MSPTQEVELQEENIHRKEDNKLFPGIGFALLALFIAIPWWLSRNRLDPYPMGQISASTIEESTEETVATLGDTDTAAQDTITLKALGDSASGYSPVQSSEFQNDLEGQGITLDYADEPDAQARITALNAGEADIIFTSMEDFLTQKPAGKIVGLLSRQEGDDPAQVKVAVASEEIMKSNPQEVEDFVAAYHQEVESSGKATDGDTKFFTAAEEQDWIKSGTLETKVGELTSKLESEGKLGDFDPNFGALFGGASFSGLASKPLEFGGKLAEGASDATANLQKKAGEVGSQVSQGASDATANLQKKAGEVGSQVSQGASDATANLQKKAGEVGSQVSQGASDATANLKEKAGEVGSQVSEGASNLTSGLQNAASPGAGELQVLEEIKFDLNSSQLNPQAQQKLDQVVAKIQQMKPTNAVIKVQGHTSSRGDDATNKELSQERAEAVVQYLKSKNLDYQFSAEGLASSAPLPGTDPAASVNQRTVVGLVETGS